MSSKYKSYQDAYKNGKRDIWPGCGDGRCMPCGRIHDFDYASWDSNGNRVYISNYSCWENYQHGCPREKPEPVHTFESGKCKVCGKRAMWMSPDGKYHRTIDIAKRKGWRRDQLVRQGE